MSWKPEKRVGSPYTYQDGIVIKGWEREQRAYEMGWDCCLEALEPLIRQVAPSSKLIDILYPKRGIKASDLRFWK